ncbi:MULTISPECIES: preprotein translocase subunit SecG [Roseateles]|uniref:Protein-export membrane protein SecG n=1 Tax=Pelomonas caseinilytica TaxID=2906763 RepID=A0ABS8XJY5_9BURK|nr:MULTISPECIES: preprotein translocase subunit SecG [unclassified Roseateles]MCE4539872.1 preprotein translocase subunit SecG [Pelomonas sp. P7]HEV6968055.1 preprotein translocase subunit SecG [Roseateles sp.]
MQFFANLVLIVQLLSALAIIGLVLVQHGKGADMGASFGSGASGSLFGATGSANFLSRSTAVAATLFFGCTLGLAFLSNGRSSAPTSDTALDRAAVVAPAASAAASGAAAIPGAIVAPVAPASAAASGAAN